MKEEIEGLLETLENEHLCRKQYKLLEDYINDLQSQLKAKEEVIKEAGEYNQKIVDDYLKEDDCEYCDGRYATATHNLEILSKGENK